MPLSDFEITRDVIKKSPATTFLVFLLVISFVSSYLWGEGASDLYTARLFGALTPFDATTDGLIRTITSIFEQIGGPIHLLLNLCAILVTGPFLERIYGPVKYTAFFLITGIFGGLFTFMFSDLYVLSAGASSSGYGLMGLYLGLILKKDPLIDKATKNLVWNLIWVNIVFTFIVPNISISGHMGGLISGTIIASLFRTKHHNCHWFIDMIKTILTFTMIVIVIQVPSIIWPNTPLPFIQEIREKVGLKTIDEVPNPFGNELIYNIKESSMQQYQPPNSSNRMSLDFMKENYLELFVTFFLIFIIWTVGKSLLLRKDIRKFIKNSPYYSTAKKNPIYFLLNQMGENVIRNYMNSHPKLKRKKVVSVTQFELQQQFGTVFQKNFNRIFRVFQVILLIFSIVMLVFMLSIFKNKIENTAIPVDSQEMIALENDRKEEEKSIINIDEHKPNIREETKLPLDSLYIFGYDIPLQEVFNNERFTDLKITHQSGSLYIAGYYKGALVSSDHPYLEIQLSPIMEGNYTTDYVIYNGKTLGNKGIYNVIDLLLTGRQSYGDLEIIYTEEEVLDSLLMNQYIPDGYQTMIYGVEGDDYVVQIYEDQESHAATQNWYFVNKYTLEITSMF